MSKLAGIFACTTVVAVIVVVQLWHQLRVERSRTEQFQANVTQRPMEDAPRIDTLRGLKQEPGATPQVENSPPVTETSSGERAETKAPSAINIDMRQFLKDPKFKEAQRAQIRLQMPQAHPDVARELGLTTEEADEFFDLLAKQQFDRMMLTVASGDGDENDRAAAQRELLNAQRNDQAATARLLGPSRELAWQAYQQSLGARRQVNQLGTLLTASGRPLTDSQNSELTALIAAEQQRLKEESRSRAYTQIPLGEQPNNNANLKAIEESNARIVESARTYLDARQLAALKTSMAQRNGMVRVIVAAPRE